jgi:hypothetical protein
MQESRNWATHYMPDERLLEKWNRRENDMSGMVTNQELARRCRGPPNLPTGDFLLAADLCVRIKGSGTRIKATRQRGTAALSHELPPSDIPTAEAYS